MTDLLERLRLVDPASDVGGWSESVDGRAVRAAIRQPRKRSRWVLAVAAAALVLAVTVATYAIVRADSPSSSNDVTSDTGNPAPSVSSIADLESATWKTIDNGPLTNQEQVLAAAWTGDELLVETRPRGSAPSASFAYAPTSHTWRRIAAPPIAWRQSPVSVWTGTDWIIWGGANDTSAGVASTQVPADGAMYDPKTDTWTEISPSPIGGLSDASSVWTGTELIVTGGQASCSPGQACGGGIALGAQASAAAYDPASNTWRSIAAPPVPVFANARPVRTAWSGTNALFVGPHVGTTDTDDLVEAYDPATDTWTTGTFPNRAIALTAHDGAGLGVSAIGATYQAVKRDANTAEFSPLGEPLAVAGCGSELSVASDRAIVIDCGHSSTPQIGANGEIDLPSPDTTNDALYGFDTATSAWTDLPAAPSHLDYMFWTDHGLIGIDSFARVHLLTPEPIPDAAIATTVAPTTSPPSSGDLLGLRATLGGGWTVQPGRCPVTNTIVVITTATAHPVPSGCPSVDGTWMVIQKTPHDLDGIDAACGPGYSNDMPFCQTFSTDPSGDPASDGIERRFYAGLDILVSVRHTRTAGGVEPDLSYADPNLAASSKAQNPIPQTLTVAGDGLLRAANEGCSALDTIATTRAITQCRALNLPTNAVLDGAGSTTIGGAVPAETVAVRLTAGSEPLLYLVRVENGWDTTRMTFASKIGGIERSTDTSANPAQQCVAASPDAPHNQAAIVGPTCPSTT